MLSYKVLIFILFCFQQIIAKEVENGTSLIGLYKGERSGTELILKQNSEFYLLASTYASQKFDHILDTLSFGNWLYEEGLLQLTSHHSILNKRLTINVDEIYNNNIGDTVVVEITNPYETTIKKRGWNDSNDWSFDRRPFHYNVYFGGANFGVYEREIKIGCLKKFPKETQSSIYDFSILIIPNNQTFIGHIPYHFVETKIYETKNRGSNYFKINIPELTEYYMFYKRFNGEYIKVINKKRLLWDNEFFIKQNK